MGKESSKELWEIFLNIAPYIGGLLVAISGGILGLRYHEPKTRGDAWRIVLGGFCIGILLGGSISEYFELNYFITATLTLVLSTGGMFVLDGLMVLFKRFSTNPIKTIKEVKALKEDDELEK